MSVADQPEDVLDSGEAGGRAIRGGALFTVTYVFGLLLSIASVPFMIRHLGVVDYGYYVSVSAVVFIIGGFTEAGLTNLGIREYSQLRAGGARAVPAQPGRPPARPDDGGRGHRHGRHRAGGLAGDRRRRRGDRRASAC